MAEVTEFDELDPQEFHLVPEGATGFPVLLAKAAEMVKEEAEKAEMDAKERHGLDTSDFAFPKQRKEPINDAAHVRNALSRFGQVQGVSAEEKHEAARRILARAKHFGIDVSEDSDVAQAAKQTADDKAVPRSEAETQTDEVSEDVASGTDPDNEDGGESHESGWTAVMHTSQGTTADDKAVPRSEADSQTDGAQKAEGDGAGTAAPDAAGATANAEHEAATQTAEVEKADATTPGSDAWEHEDVALGEKAEHLVSQLADVVHTFTEREKAEGGASKELRRAAKAARSLLKNTDRLRKVADQMTDTSELVKVLGEYDAARRAEKKAQKDAKAEKAAKRERKAAKAAEEAAKAVDDSEQNPELAKARAELTALQERVEKMESADAKRIVTDPSALVTALRGGPESAGNVFKQLEDDLAAAKETYEKNPSRVNESRMKEAGNRLVKAKLIAQDTSRTEDPRYVSASLRGQGFPMFVNSQSYTDPQVEDRR